MSAAILGMGVVAPGAVGLAALAAGLQEPAREPPRVARIRDEGEARMRRAPRLERMVLAAAKEALGKNSASPNLAVVFGTGYGGLGATVEFLEGMAVRGPAFASPTSFHQSVHHSPLGTLSIALGIRGPCFTVSARELSGESALKVGLDLLAAKRAERVLVVAADELVPALEAAYQAFGSSLVPGEGAAAVLLGPVSDDTGPVTRIEGCALTGHSVPLLRFPASTDRLVPLLRQLEGLTEVGISPWPPRPIATADDSLFEAERAALDAVFSGWQPVDDRQRFGVNPSGGLLRVVAAALRLEAARQGAFLVHGASLGGGQAGVTLRRGLHRG